MNKLAFSLITLADGLDALNLTRYADRVDAVKTEVADSLNMDKFNVIWDVFDFAADQLEQYGEPYQNRIPEILNAFEIIFKNPTTNKLLTGLPDSTAASTLSKMKKMHKALKQVQGLNASVIDNSFTLLRNTAHYGRQKKPKQ